MESAISARVAQACGRDLGQEISAQEEHLNAKSVASAKQEVFSLVRSSFLRESPEDTRWVLTWKMADGEKSVKARLAAKSFLDPFLQEGLADTSGCVRLPSSHPEMTSRPLRLAEKRAKRAHVSGRDAVASQQNSPGLA